MKKLKIGLFVLFLLIATISAKDVFAATNNDMLISLGTGSYQITVYKSTTIDDIINVLGEPKLVTDSAFGGQAYTFYTDDNYSNYLYVETTNEGNIISYGSIDETYKTNTYSYGDNYPYTERTPLYGYLFSKDGYLGGGIYYNKTALFNGSYNDIINYYSENYNSNPIKYLKGLSQQAILMYNALSYNLGNKDVTPLVFDEDNFYINEQFKELGTTSREYMNDMELNTSYMKGIGVRTSVEITTPYYVLNPLMFAEMAFTNKYTVFGDKTIAVFDYDKDRKILSAIALSESAFERNETITLTEEELSKLSSGREEYNSAIDNFKKATSVFDIEPISTVASNLVAGELNDYMKKGITDYVNAIRVAAGAPRVQLSEENFNVAQHKATLLSYRYQVLGLGITHSPEHPSGVSDEFYNTAMGNNVGISESVGLTTSPINMNTMMETIDIFLDDSAEENISFSHRQRILDSGFTNFGFGFSPYVFVNEFNGVSGSDNYLEAWPANGITFMESLVYPNFYWTAQFVDKYTILDTTTATIKCLNTDETWEFTEQEKNNNRWFACSTDSIAQLNNRVIMYDSSIVVQPGYVYEITLHDIKDNNTSKVVDYTYRSAFEYADVSNYPSTLDRLSIDVPDNSDFKYDEDYEAYMLPIGQEINLDVELDTSIVDKKVTWRSSNDKVKVTQNGIIYADEILDEDEVAIISVSYDGSNITDEILVKTYRKLDEIILDKQNMDCLALGSELSEPSFSLYIEYIPTDANEVKSVNWKVVSNANPNIEYDMNDEYIQKYVKIVKDSSDPRRVDVYAVTAEMNNNKYTIIAEVEGISGTYTGGCELTINVPISRINIIPASNGLSISSSVLNINYNSYNNNTFNLSTEISPENTTYDKTINWTIEGNEGIISKNSSSINNATFNILKEGETKLTAKSVNDKTDTITVRISVELTKLALSSDYLTAYTNSTVRSNTAQLRLIRTPSIDSDPITYSSNANNIATVDKNGLVTFKNPGEVKITAKSDVNNVNTTITFDVYTLISSIKITNAGSGTVTINKGETFTPEISLEPSNNSYSDRIQYESNKSDVAKVDANGKVTGVGPGTATITVRIPGAYTTNNVERKITYDVNVKAPIEGVNLPETKTMIVNTTSTLSVDILPSDTTSGHAIEWSTENPDIVDIDTTTGLATAKKEGKATINVKVTDTETGETFTDSMTINVVNYLKGDMNKDGAVNSVDAAIVIDKYKTNNITDEDYAIGDMDENQTLNSRDAAYIIDLYKKNTAIN